MRNVVLHAAFHSLLISHHKKIRSGTDAAGIVSASQNAEQAVQALIVLGYTQSEAAQAVAKLDGSLSTEELIRGALKSMASRF